MASSNNLPHQPRPVGAEVFKLAADEENKPFGPSSAENRAPVISIIVPTFNERANIARVVKELYRVMSGVEWEVIFVDDDSPDGTADVVREIGQQQSRVRCVHRIGRRGLSEACVDGMLASSAPYLALMDGDLQHDPSVVQKMLRILEEGEAELVIGSRFVDGGSCGDMPERRRRFSRLAAQLGRIMLSQQLKDPMSNFFALRRELFEEVVRGLSKLGFKILLDILLTARRPVKVREIPFVLGNRNAGDSKFDLQVAWEYAMLLADKAIGRFVPVRFVAFATIGSAGVGVHLLVLACAYRLAGLSFISSVIAASLISMAFNYTLNNALTYSDRRKRGLQWLTGFVSFAIVCGIGAAANIGIAAFLFNKHANWLAAAVLGVIVGAVWNYAVTGFYTWGRNR